MDVILLEKIDNLGGIGDRVKVKSGYARNFLIPQGKATMATAQNIAKFEKIRAELEAKAASELDAARARASEIEGQVLNISVQAGSEGRLFGSIGTIDIADAFAALGIDIERSEIRMPEGPLRVVGEHEVEIHLHADVNVPVRVVLEGPEGTEPSTLEEEAAAEADVEAPEADPEAPDADLEASEADQEAAEADLEASEADLKASEADLEASEADDD